MARSTVTATITAIAILTMPAISLAQSGGSSGGSAGGSAGGAAGGTTTGSSNVGSPAAGSAGAGAAGVNGIPPVPATVGGQNNSRDDPSGAGNSAKLRAPGTNSAGTAQSSGSGVTSGAAANSGAGVTTGSARSARGGVNVTGPQTSGDAVINEENRMLDRKLKSICRGC